MNKAIDEIRQRRNKTSAATMATSQILKHSRWCLLKRPQNLTDKQTVKISELMRYNLRTVKGYLHKEEFQRFWHVSAALPGLVKFLDEWTTRVLRSRLEPLKKVAPAVCKRHRELLLNYFRAQKEFSSGVVEGMNNKAKLTTRKAYGFRTETAIKTALYHSLGKLPEPKFTHTFW